MTPDKYNDCGKGIPYITGASNIENGIVLINRWTEYGRAFAYCGDILLTCKGTVGTMAVLQEPQVHIAKSIFSSRIVCGDCGSYFGSKVRNSTSKYRRVIWQCNGKYKGDHKCTTPHLMEEEIKAAFLAALDGLLAGSETLLEDCSFMYDTLADVSGIAAECESLADEMETLSIRIERLITENATTVQDQDEYQQKYGRLERQFESAKRKYAALEEKKKGNLS